MEWVLVQNGLGYELCLVNNFDVLIANSLFANNIGGGMLIYSHRNGNIEFNNYTIYNNNAKYHGGGVSINSYEKNSIEFNNCTIHKNIAHYGGGVYNGNIEFHHCAVYNNIVQKKQGGGGGGVYIYSKNGNIKFNEDTIYNNAVQHCGGGGALILSFGTQIKKNDFLKVFIPTWLHAWLYTEHISI